MEMSAYSKEYNFLFIHIPKNAGSTFIQNYTKLNEVCLIETLNSRLGFARDPVFGNHFTYEMFADLIKKKNLNIDVDNMYKFCVIRNPWERMFSLYQHRLRKIDAKDNGIPRNTEKDKQILKQGFNHWLLKTTHVSDRVLTKTAQSFWIKNQDGDLIPDKIINFENYDNELDEIVKHLKLPIFDRKNYNISKKKSSLYREVYNSKSIKHVRKYFKEDIDRFKFVF